MTEEEFIASALEDKREQHESIRKAAMYFAGLLIVDNPQSSTRDIAERSFDLARMMDLSFQQMLNASRYSDHHILQVAEDLKRERAAKRT